LSGKCVQEVRESMQRRFFLGSAALIKGNGQRILAEKIGSIALL